MPLTPGATYTALLIVQALHLLHHRLTKRHISFAEVISAFLLCVPPSAPAPSGVLMAGHVTMILVQLAGSLWIRRLSPRWAE
jgi:hypothetical protein